ncbi:MAG TPA: hypothetical protein VKB43_04350 [Gaiellaceae bacterium]|nr:hypothetical protein [Gaiellaceae bacterium]
MGASLLRRAVIAAVVVAVVALAVPAALADVADSKGECEWDSAAQAVRVCFTMSYERGTYRDSLETVALDNYHFVATNHDPTVSIVSAVFHGGIQGHDTEGNNYVDVAGQKTDTGPSFGVSHGYAPWWASPNRRLIIPNGEPPGFYQCGNVVLKFKRGGTTWSLQMDNLCIGSLLGDPFATR